MSVLSFILVSIAGVLFITCSAGSVAAVVYNMPQVFIICVVGVVVGVLLVYAGWFAYLSQTVTQIIVKRT